MPSLLGSFLLADIVEIDETYIGGNRRQQTRQQKDTAGRGAVGRQSVMGMCERGGRVKAISVHRTDKETLQGNVSAHVKSGSTVYSDGHRAYIGSGTRKEFTQGMVKHSVAEYANGMAHTNGIESVWAVLKR